MIFISLFIYFPADGEKRNAAPVCLHSDYAGLPHLSGLGRDCVDKEGGGVMSLMKINQRGGMRGSGMDSMQREGSWVCL